MAPKVELSNLLRMSKAWQWLARMSPEEIDAAMRYVEFLERAGGMDAREAADWRWRLMACWAELHRKPRRGPSPAGGHGGHVLQLEPG